MSIQKMITDERYKSNLRIDEVKLQSIEEAQAEYERLLKLSHRIDAFFSSVIAIGMFSLVVGLPVLVNAGIIH